MHPAAQVRFALLGLCALTSLSTPTAVAAQEAKGPPRIEDNSFLIEEAYNQGAGVVQHIAALRRPQNTSWAFTFTQEWPAPTQLHQLSYTVPVVAADGSGTGLGDVALNYRYQMLGRDDEAVWFAPRISALIPTGSTQYGRGVGGAGVQVNLPLSIRVSPLLVTHWNLGTTITHSHSYAGARGTPVSYNVGGSAILLLSPNLNLMLEALFERNETLLDGGDIWVQRRTTIVPGLRGAINLASGMQIVPGIGVPMSGPRLGTGTDLFFYLSVEHAFR